jgi:cyclase
MTVRIIPRLDIKGPNLVKGVHLEGLRVLGKPEDFARLYYENGADELFYQDAVASLYNRNSLAEIISRTSNEIFIPLCVGGGLRTVDDIRSVLRAGADKVSINTAAINRPAFISEAAKAFGSSTIVVGIEAIKQPNGEYRCFTDSGRQETDVEVVAWAKQAESLGAGELLLTSVDQEGTGKGFDVALTKQISELVSIPVVAHGGAGDPGHVVQVIDEGRADAVCLASMLHYDAIDSIEIDSDAYEAEGNTEFLKRGAPFSRRISPTALADLKAELLRHGIDVRPIGAKS